MATIRRGTIVRDIIDSLKLQVAGVMPDQTSDKLVLTYDFKNVQVINSVKVGTCANATSTTIYTTPSNKDFYIHALAMNVVKDATNTSTLTAINCSINGALQNILYIAGVTLVAQNDTISISLPIPIKVDPNTAITLTNSSGASNIRSSCSVYSTEVER